MKTAELAGALLNYWVAMAGEEWKHVDTSNTMTLDPSYKGVRLVTYGDGSQAAILQPNNPMRQDPREFSPSTDWEQGGPIIEREKMTIAWDVLNQAWAARLGSFQHLRWSRGEAPLVAAMRAYVAGKFGDEVPENTPAGAA